jgi:hypothetical protein
MEMIGILLLEVGVIGHKFSSGAVHACRLFLKTYLPFPCIEELGGGNVESDEDVLTEFVACFINGLGDHFEGVVCGFSVGAKPPSSPTAVLRPRS